GSKNVIYMCIIKTDKPFFHFQIDRLAKYAPFFKTIAAMWPYFRCYKPAWKGDVTIGAKSCLGEQIIGNPSQLPPGMMRKRSCSFIHGIPVVRSDPCTCVHKCVPSPYRSSCHIQQ